jgi:hypothetical protein
LDSAVAHVEAYLGATFPSSDSLDDDEDDEEDEDEDDEEMA